MRLLPEILDNIWGLMDLSEREKKQEGEEKSEDSQEGEEHADDDESTVAEDTDVQQKKEENSGTDEMTLTT